MEVVPCADDGEVSTLAADAVAALVRRRPGAVLGVATGSTPAGLYRELVRRRRDGVLSLATTTVFLLDEYVGLPSGHPASYREEIRRALGPAGVPDGGIHAPDGAAADLAGEGDRYEAAIATAGGVDLQVVGIGANGHLAFNEPSSSLASRTRVKTLTARTRADNARFFASPDEVPTHVLTQGLGTIRDARHVVLLALGERKAAALAAAVEGPVTARCPASVLQLHPHVTVLVDPPAATRLQDLDHYRHVWRHKPYWQGL
ncbi:MAG: glucosamine-6-phosphate deaminase [Kineosporiaceae bacterium]